MRGRQNRTGGYPDASMSSRKAEEALTHLLYLCTLERLAGFTAEGLSKSYNVPVERTTAMLEQARRGRKL